MTPPSRPNSASERVIRGGDLLHRSPRIGPTTLVSWISRHTPIPGQTPKPASWFAARRSEVIHTFHNWVGFDPAEVKRSMITITPLHPSLLPTRTGW